MRIDPTSFLLKLRVKASPWQTNDICGCEIKARIFSTIKGHENVDSIKWRHLISALCA